jgi:ATP-dependent helicase/nuclease subunit A
MARELTPFDFFSRVLGPIGGRQAVLARLGPESGDVLDEFLNLALAHESRQAPSLNTFIAEVESSSGMVKRDLDSSDSQVRVMTIHAAKGLEAKVVFLPDVCATPTSRLDLPIFAIDTPEGRQLPVWSARKEQDCSRLAELRTRRREANLGEYRRLLYVAMTRAEERLYIAGHCGKNDFPPDSWRSMIKEALGTEAIRVPAPWGNGDSVLRFGDGQPADVSQEHVFEQPASTKALRPAWLTVILHGIRTPALG